VRQHCTQDKWKQKEDEPSITLNHATGRWQQKEKAAASLGEKIWMEAEASACQVGSCRMAHRHSHDELKKIQRKKEAREPIQSDKFVVKIQTQRQTALFLTLVSIARNKGWQGRPNFKYKPVVSLRTQFPSFYFCIKSVKSSC